MTFRTAWTHNDGLTVNTSSAAGTIPATVQAGDVLAVISVQNTGSATHTISGGNVVGGWTVRSGPDDNSNAQRTYVWTAVASASSAGSTVTIASSSGGRLIGAGFAASGITESSVLIALTTDTTSDTSLAWPSVTIPAGGNAWELYSLATMRAATVPSFTVPPSGASIDAKAATNFGTSPQFIAVALHEPAQVPPGSGSTSFGTANTDTAVTNNLYTIAFQSSGPQIGSGSLAASGSGSLSLSGRPIDSGQLIRSGSGALALSGVQVGSGQLISSGSGALALSGTGTGFATGSLARAGSGSLVFAVSQATAAGLLARSGSGALSLAGKPAVNPSLSRTGSGVLIVAGKPVALARTGSGLLVFAGRAVYRHQMWDGVKWTEIVPLTFDGTGFVTVPVKLKAGLRGA